MSDKNVIAVTAKAHHLNLATLEGEGSICSGCYSTKPRIICEQKLQPAYPQVILVKGSRLRRDGEVSTVKLGRSTTGQPHSAVRSQAHGPVFAKKEDYSIKNPGENAAASANDKHGGHLDVIVDVTETNQRRIQRVEQGGVSQ
jgi:hypothetical protein